MRRTLSPLVAAALVGGLAACAAPATDAGEEDGPGAAVIRREADPSGLKGSVLQTPMGMPGVTLTATDGSDFDLVTDTTAPVTLVFFGYTHCPDICNAVLADVATALRRADPSVRDAVRLLFVTTDPARDTPDVVREYLDRFDPGFEGLTGELTTIEQAADHLGVALEGRLDLPGGGYEVGHGTQLIGFEADDLSRVQWPQGTPIGDLGDDLALLVERQA